MKPRYFALLLLLSCHSAHEPASPAIAYYRLGDSLLEKGYCDSAVKAFQTAERLGFQPRADLMYKLSASYAGKTKYEIDSNDDCLRAAARYSELAIQMGYSHPENFRNDRRFAGLKEVGYFIQSYTDALGGAGKAASPEKTLCESFVSEFNPMSLPLTIDQGWIQSHPLECEIAYVYEPFVPEMRTTKFTRGTEYLYYYVGMVKQTPEYTALLYAGKSLELMRDAEDTRATFFFLVTYDAWGRIIDKLMVAGQRDLTDPVRTVTLQPDLSFAVRSSRNIYAHDPGRNGYENNPVLRSEPAGETGYRIAANGKFERLQPALAVR